MLKKNAQITLYIIIGIILIFVTLLLLILANSYDITGFIKTHTQYSTINAYFESNLEEGLKQDLRILGLKAGYIVNEPPYSLAEASIIKGINISFINSQLERATRYRITKLIYAIEKRDKLKFSKDYNIKTKITKEGVFLEINNLKYTHGELIRSLDKFKIRVNIRLYDQLNLASYILHEKQRLNLNLLQDKDFYIEFYPAGKNYLIIRIIDIKNLYSASHTNLCLPIISHYQDPGKALLGGPQ